MDNTKKRILIFVPEFPVITETFILREVEKLTDFPDLDIKVVAIKKGVGLIPAKLRSLVCFHKLSLIDALVAAFRFAFLVLFRFDKFIDLLRVLSASRRSFFSKVYLIYRTTGYYVPLFLSFAPDVIYVHFMSESSTIAMLASRLTNIPYAISAHAKDIFVWGELIQEKAKSAKFITICNKNAFDYVKRESKGGNVNLIYHGYDFSLSDNAVREHPESEAPVLFTSGRFTEKKGHTYLLRASKILKDRGISHKIYLLGSGGELYKSTLDEIQKLGLGSIVEIVNNGKGVPFEETVKYYAASNIFVYPGIQSETNDVDGIATVLIEAASFKLPIIATDSGSTQDLVLDKNTGIVVKQRDPEALAEAITWVLANKDEATKLGNNAYNKARTMFDINRNVLIIRDLLCA